MVCGENILNLAQNYEKMPKLAILVQEISDFGSRHIFLTNNRAPSEIKPKKYCLADKIAKMWHKIKRKCQNWEF